MSQSETPVLIAGGGATGTMLALLLAQQGVRSVVAETRETPYDIPRAHAVNPRSLEICNALGLDIARMRREAAPRAEAGQVLFLTRLFGRVLGRLPYERQDDEAFAATPFPLVNLPQTEFEAILFEAVAREPLIEMHRGWRWESASRENGKILSTIAAGTSRLQVASQFLVGCDGAGSPVRESLNIGMTGEAAVISSVSIIFRADLRRQLADRPGMLFWCLDPAAKGHFLGYHMDRLWSHVRRHPPGKIDMSLYDEARCRALVLEAAGGDIPDLEIVKATPWTMTSQIADRYGDGRILLAGDAAHRFPPTGGLGLNTGIQDVHNLAWKIAAIESGRASDALLGTYESERRPVALRNAEQSLGNAHRLAALSELSCPESIWQDDAKFALWLSEDDKANKIRAAVNLQAEHFDSFGLQLGFSYPPSLDRIENAGTYVPSAAPGHRMPHAWLNGEGREKSTLDLLNPCRFTLFSGLGADIAFGDRFDLNRIDLNDQRIPAAWRMLLGLAPNDVLLVRPDGHVAYRGPVAGVDAALATLLLG